MRGFRVWAMGGSDFTMGGKDRWDIGARLKETGLFSGVDQFLPEDPGRWTEQVPSEQSSRFQR